MLILPGAKGGSTGGTLGEKQKGQPHFDHEIDEQMMPGAGGRGGGVSAPESKCNCPACDVSR